MRTAEAGLAKTDKDTPGWSTAAAHQKFVALDSWRGVCAILVVIYHFHVGERLFHINFFANAYLFVDFFFVLSGFVIQHTYGARIRGAPSAVSYLIKRFGRLWPLHVTVLAGLVLFEFAKLAVASVQGGGETAAFTDRFAVSGIFTSVLLLQGWGMHAYTVWNGPSWSVSTELFAYIAFALTCFLKGRARAVAQLGLILLGLVVVVACGQFMTTDSRFGLFRCIVGFFLGVFAYRAYVSAGGWYRALPRGVAWWFELGVSVIALVYLSTLESLPRTTLAPFVFCLVVFVFAFERGPLSVLLATKPARTLGQLSYSIYMVHDPLVTVAYRVAQFMKPRGFPDIFKEYRFENYTGTAQIHTLNIESWWGVWAAELVFVAVVVAVSAVTYRWLEDPTRRWFKLKADTIQRRLEARSAGAPQARPSNAASR